MLNFNLLTFAHNIWSLNSIIVISCINFYHLFVIFNTGFDKNHPHIIDFHFRNIGIRYIHAKNIFPSETNENKAQISSLYPSASNEYPSVAAIGTKQLLDGSKWPPFAHPLRTSQNPFSQTILPDHKLRARIRQNLRPYPAQISIGTAFSQRRRVVYYTYKAGAWRPASIGTRGKCRSSAWPQQTPVPRGCERPRPPCHWTRPVGACRLPRRAAASTTPLCECVRFIVLRWYTLTPTQLL